MFVLGHLGIGKKLAARPYRRFSHSDKRAFFLGALLPDLVDKPLYYGFAWLTGKPGAAGTFSGTHLFAHTGLFLAVLAVAGWVTRSRPLQALAERPVQEPDRTPVDYFPPDHLRRRAARRGHPVVGPPNGSPRPWLFGGA
jgi:hypothetical protein